ncbi:MAG: hypothetical protein DDT40_00759 [candidate division WS2 bacterium]|nr:hypothetical protein [Candidatus Psychracetigena formicireducens]
MRKIRFLGYSLFLMFFCQTLFGAEAPKLRFEKMIGDMRGKGMNNLSVTIADNGTIYLLMQPGRIAVFDEKGKYQKSLKVTVPWPDTFCYLSAMGNLVLLGDYKKDYPWVYSLQRKGNNPGSFLNPAMVTTDEKENIYVADTGNARIQIFTPDSLETPKEVIALTAKPIGLSVRGNSMAIITGDNNLLFYELSTDKFSFRSSLAIGRAARAVAVGPDGRSVFVAFSEGPDLHQLKKYELKKGALEEISVIAPSYVENWPDINFFTERVSMVTGPDGEIWFATDVWQKIVSLNPETDDIRERLRVNRPLTLGFDAGGKIYVGGFAPCNAEGPGLLVFSETGPQASGEKFPETGLLYKQKDVPVWGILPDEDGGVYVRVVEEGYRKGWPAFAIKKIYRDGTIKPFIDFGFLFAKRTRFHPAATFYSLQFDKEGNIILTSLPLVSVMKINPAGEIKWEAGLQPQGGADEVNFGSPRDTAIDSKGNIWVVDSAKNKVFCLSPSGKVLLEYGDYANVDDTEGKGFDMPSGIEVAMVGEKEFLYVGDAGNGRIVKYEIIW